MAKMMIKGPPDSSWTFPGGRSITFDKGGTTSADLDDVEIQQAVSSGFEVVPPPAKTKKGGD